MRRALVVALLAASLTACASDPSTIGSSATTTTHGGVHIVVVPQQTTTTGGRRAQVASPPTTDRAVPVPLTTSTTVLGGPGANAARYLRPSGARSITIQVLSQPGAEPRQASMGHVVSELEQASGKDVTVVGGSISSSTQTWTDATLEGVASSKRPTLAYGAALIQYVFVHGSYRGDDSVLGLTLTGDLTAIFSDEITAAATGLATPGRVEESVTTHELGHLMGLVDLYLHTGRADPQHPGHSTNPHSVMYWAVETDLVGDLLSGGPPTEFDDADRADLATIRHG